MPTSVRLSLDVPLRLPFFGTIAGFEPLAGARLGGDAGRETSPNRDCGGNPPENELARTVIADGTRQRTAMALRPNPCAQRAEPRFSRSEEIKKTAT